MPTHYLLLCIRFYYREGAYRQVLVLFHEAVVTDETTGTTKNVLERLVTKDVVFGYVFVNDDWYT